MKPAFESVATSSNTSFLIRRFEEKIFSSSYHFHPEYELTLILEGSGKRYVGTNMQDYFPGDLVLLGSNLPHCWKTGGSPAGNSVSIVLHFKEDFMGGDFFYKPEMYRILQLLHSSHSGLQFTDGAEAVKEKMIALTGERDSYKKLTAMLDLLYALASSASCTELQKQGVYSALSVAERERINNVMAYILDNFQKSISLKEAASKANMTSHAFCKYFKRLTKKTFLEAVNDYRIDFAVRQLVHTDKTVSQIGFDSGFNDISNFHKTFRNRIHLSPLNYRNRFIKSDIGG